MELNYTGRLRQCWGSGRWGSGSEMRSMCNSPLNLSAAVGEHKFSYHNPETISFSLCPYYGNFKLSSLKATQIYRDT